MLSKVLCQSTFWNGKSLTQVWKKKEAPNKLPNLKNINAQQVAKSKLIFFNPKWTVPPTPQAIEYQDTAGNYYFHKFCIWYFHSVKYCIFQIKRSLSHQWNRLLKSLISYQILFLYGQVNKQGNVCYHGHVTGHQGENNCDG